MKGFSKLILISAIISLSSWGNKAKDYQFVNRLLYFTLENKVPMSREIESYINQLITKYNDDKDYLLILRAKGLYARGIYKESKKILLSIEPSSKYFYDVNHDLFTFSTLFQDQGGVDAAINNFFRQYPSKEVIKKFTRKEIKKLAGQYLASLNADRNRRKDAVHFKVWLKDNNMTIEEGASSIERLRHWEKVADEIDELEEKYLGLYQMNTDPIDNLVRVEISNKIKLWEAHERKYEDLFTLFINVEIARARVIAQQYKIAERIIADNFTKLEAFHGTTFAKNKEISPLFAARYVLGLCYLARAKIAHDKGDKNQIKALLLGGTKRYKNGAAQNFFFILKENAKLIKSSKPEDNRESRYKWKAFDRYEYSTRPSVSKWLGKKIPSLITSKKFALENVSRLLVQERHELLFTNADLVLAEDKFSAKEKLEVSQIVLQSYVLTFRFKEAYDYVKKLELKYSSKEDSLNLAKTMQSLGAICFKKRKEYKDNDLDLSNKFNDFLYFSFEKAYKKAPGDPLSADTLYFLGTDQYELSYDENISSEEREEARQKSLRYLTIIVNEYPSYTVYDQTVYLIADIYSGLYYEEIKKEQSKVKGKYKDNSLKFYKAFEEAVGNDSNSVVQKVSAMYEITNILQNEREDPFEEKGFIYYVNRINQVIEDTNTDLFSEEDKETLAAIKKNTFLSEKILYEFEIEKLQGDIDAINKSLSSKDIAPGEFKTLKKKLDKTESGRNKFITALVSIIERALDEGYYTHNEAAILDLIANNFTKLKKEEEAEKYYSLLSKKYPRSSYTKSIIFRKVFSLVSENKIQEAIDEFNLLKDKLNEQEDSSIAKIFSYFYHKTKPFNIEEELFNKMVGVSLFCAQTRLKALPSEREKEMDSRRLEIAQCFYNLKQYDKALGSVGIVIKNSKGSVYDALLLEGEIYRAKNDPQNAFETYAKLYQYVARPNVIDEVIASKDWPEEEKQRKSTLFKERFDLLKFSSLSSTIELAYEIKNYNKALIHIAKLESQSPGKLRGLEKYYETAAAIKILSKAENGSNVDLLKAVRSFTEVYPSSKWLKRIRNVLN